MNEVIIADNQADLDRVVHKALKQIEAIIDQDIEALTKTEDKLKMLSIKKDAATAIINAGLKADENRFRRENKDIVERLFLKIKNDSKIVDGHVLKKV
jgi:hypothetical protein